jgi:hypothetical protein
MSLPQNQQPMQPTSTQQTSTQTGQTLDTEEQSVTMFSIRLQTYNLCILLAKQTEEDYEQLLDLINKVYQGTSAAISLQIEDTLHYIPANELLNYPTKITKIYK